MGPESTPESAPKRMQNGSKINPEVYPNQIGFQFILGSNLGSILVPSRVPFGISFGWIPGSIPGSGMDTSQDPFGILSLFIVVSVWEPLHVPSRIRLR